MDINNLKKEISQDQSNIDSLDKLEHFKNKYLGRKGALAQLTSIIPSLPVAERAGMGQTVNALKNELQAFVDDKQRLLGSQSSKSTAQAVDLSMPGVCQTVGRLHPITQVIEEICTVFMNMGFEIYEGPEIETEFNNFTGLNIPLEHPSRDAFDTFYLKDYDKLLLRSQTSPVQVRVMQKTTPPLAIIAPGRVYRPDAVDASHLFMFHQIEGFVVDEHISMADLKGSLDLFLKKLLGKNIKTRFRPHFFPFTEPSAEVDVSCLLCAGKGCSACGRKGWIEIMGSGMIHPNVFRHVGYDLHKVSGYAFGLGVERIAMLKFGINDIRFFYENDLRFLEQF